MSKKKKAGPPGNESIPELRKLYLTCNWTAGKDIAKRKFKIRFAVDPENVFFGPPNGSLIYAGPLPEEEEYPELHVFDKPVTAPGGTNGDH